jgi:hypothetical protein
MSDDSTCAVGRASLLVWPVSADQEEPWRRFLQELSGSRFKEYTKSRRRLGIFAESVWFAPKPSGGGLAVVFLEAEDSERAMRESVTELAASETSFDSWLRRKMHELFGCDFARLPRAARGELLFAWPEVSGEGSRRSHRRCWREPSYERAVGRASVTTVTVVTM